MRKIVFFMTAGLGTDTAEGYLVPEDVSDDDLSTFAWELAVNEAESYGIYEPSMDDSDDFDEEALYAWEKVEGYWREYNAKEHAGLLLTGHDSEVYWNTYHV